MFFLAVARPKNGSRLKGTGGCSIYGFFVYIHPLADRIKASDKLRLYAAIRRGPDIKKQVPALADNFNLAFGLARVRF